MTDVVGNMTNCAEFAADGSCKVNPTVSIANIFHAFSVSIPTIQLCWMGSSEAPTMGQERDTNVT